MEASNELPGGPHSQLLRDFSPTELSAVADGQKNLRQALKYDIMPQGASRSEVAETFAQLTYIRAFLRLKDDTGHGDPDLDSVLEDFLLIPPGISRCRYLGDLGTSLFGYSLQQQGTFLLRAAESALQAAIEWLPDDSAVSTLAVVEFPSPQDSTLQPEGGKISSKTMRMSYVGTLGSIKQRLHKLSRKPGYLSEAKELFEEYWAGTSHRGAHVLAKGLALVKTYDILFAHTGDDDLLRKGMEVLDEILLFRDHRVQAIIAQCGFRLRLWGSNNDVTLLNQAIQDAETIRPEVGDAGQDQIPVHLGNLMNLYLERSSISNDTKDLEKAIKVAKDVLNIANTMEVGEVSETEKLIAQARALAEYGRCVLLRYQHTQDPAFLYDAISIAKESTPLRQKLGDRDPNRLYNQVQLASLRCHLSHYSSEGRDLTESIEWLQDELKEVKGPGDRLQLQCSLFECLGARYCSVIGHDEADVREMLRLLCEIRKVSTSFSNLAQVLLMIYHRNNDLDMLNQAIDINSGGVGHAPLILAEALLTRTHRLNGLAWSNDAEAALECLKQYVCHDMITPITFIRAAMFLSDDVFVSNRKIEMSLLASVTKKAVHQLPRAASRALTRQDIQKNLVWSIGLATTAAASALEAGHGADEALELLESGRGILATHLLDARVGRSQLTSSKSRRPTKKLESLLKEKMAELYGVVDRDSRDSPEQRTNVGKAYELNLEIEDILKELQSPGDQASSLLRPPRASEMRHAVFDGAIVVINASFRSDAIIVYDNKTWNLELPHLTQEGVERALRILEFLRKRPTSPHFQKLRGPSSGMLLIWLWKVAVEPVLRELGFTNPPGAGKKWPRVWWVPTGTLSQLPFHAAGLHTPGGTSSALDLIVSSYSSSINALLFAQQNLRDRSLLGNLGNTMVVVPVSKTKRLKDLPYVDREISTIKTIFQHEQSVTLDLLSEPSKEDVLTALGTCNIFHFAGHGASFIDDPDRGCLFLKDGEEDAVAVRDILSLNLRRRVPWLAYLSACSTGTNQKHALRDESVHLVAAYQLAGFQNVVGTFWEVSDSRSQMVARDFYSHLKENSIGEGHDVALALHLAIRKLRDQGVQGVPLTRMGTATSDKDDLGTAASADTQIPDTNDREEFIDEDGNEEDLEGLLSGLRDGEALGCCQKEWDQFKDDFRDAGRAKKKPSLGGHRGPDPMFWAPYFHVGL